MTKLRNMLIASIAIVALSTSAFAGNFGVGFTGSVANIEASGSSTDGVADTSTQKASVSNSAILGALFAEYTFSGDHGLTLGASMIPGSAQVSGSATTTSKIEASTTGVENEGTTSSAAVSRTADAEVSDVVTYYVELPVHSGVYLKAGYAELDVTSKYNSSNGVTYSNAAVDGAMMGIGYKGDFGGSTYFKVEGTHTAYDDFKVKSQGNSAGGSVNTVTADLDVTALTVGLGLRF